MSEKYHEIFCTRFYDRFLDLDARGYDDNITNSLRGDLDDISTSYRCLIGECESPIERLLAAELLFASNGYDRIAYAVAGDDNPPSTEGFGTYFYPQARLGQSRVDFLFVSYFRGKTSRIVVECDGHDYHDKTKAQASRDKERDRSITALGVPVYRFTGSDIYHRSEGCRQEIEGYLFAATELLLIEAGVVGGAGVSHG